MYVEPLQLGTNEMMPPNTDINFAAPSVLRDIRLSRQSPIVADALARTGLRFTLVKPTSNRLYVS